MPFPLSAQVRYLTSPTHSLPDFLLFMYAHVMLTAYCLGNSIGTAHVLLTLELPVFYVKYLMKSKLISISNPCFIIICFTVTFVLAVHKAARWFNNIHFILLLVNYSRHLYSFQSSEYIPPMVHIILQILHVER